MTATIRTRIAVAALAATTLSLATLAPLTPAGAAPFHHRHGHGWGAPVAAGLALGLVGAAIASSRAAAYDEGVVCRREGRYDDFGNYLGSVRVCRSLDD